ncbi:MAG: hypothetical protein HOC23_04280 [Halieaceae bacterium]|jgi:hypothetical protein|nr:hypothetical protein [Halieaceae bacterium]
MRHHNRSKCAGAVLLLAVIFAMLLAMIAGSVMQISMLEFRMAGNDQFLEQAFQRAHGIASAISEKAAYFPVTGGIGYTICNQVSADSNCDANIIALNPAIDTAEDGVSVNYRVERKGPFVMESLPFRLSQNAVTSSVAFDVALFETRVDVDGSDIGLGRASVAQGMALLIDNSVP